MMRQAGEHPAGMRFRGLAVVLWRAGLRISEALALSEGDLEPGRGALLVRHGKGGKRRQVGMDDCSSNLRFSQGSSCCHPVERSSMSSMAGGRR